MMTAMKYGNKRKYGQRILTPDEFLRFISVENEPANMAIGDISVEGLEPHKD